MVTALMPLRLYYIEVEGGIYFESKVEAEKALEFYSKEFPAEDYGEFYIEEIIVNRTLLQRLTNFQEVNKNKN